MTFVIWICVKLFSKRLQNESQNINYYMKNKSFKCVWPQCSYKSNVKSKLNNHIFSLSNEKLYKCDVKDCDKSYKSNKGLKRHRKSSDSGIKLKCVWPQCQFETPFGYNLKRHNLIHSEDKSFKCNFEDCNKVLVYEFGKSSHESKIILKFRETD